MIIRRYKPQDLGQVHRIYADAVLNGIASFDEVPPPPRELQTKFDGLAAGKFPFIVAESDGVVLGYAYAGPYRARTAYRFTVENSIYVAPAAKRQGLGRALLGELTALSSQAGFKQMIAVIGGPEPASLALHRACGFEAAATLHGVGFKHGRWLDLVLMQKAL